MTKEKPMLSFELLKNCSVCAKLGEHHKEPTGPISSSIMLLVTAPVAAAVEDPINFLLDEAGIDSESVYQTTLIKCECRTEITQEYVTNCVDRWLKLELRQCNPSVLVVFGELVFKVITKGKYGDFKHGKIVDTGSRKILCIMHPMYAVTGKLEEFMQAAKPLKELKDGSS